MWFPPTATPTPFSTPTPRLPTPDQRPALGEVVLSDRFDTPGAWPVGVYNGGTAAYGGQSLDVVTQPLAGASLVLLRSGGLPTDFYLELTARTSLCRARDSYGLILRAEGEQQHYRLLLNCEGQLRVERWRPSEVGVLQDWTPSGQVPAGAPVSSRLGVWMFRDEMRVFVNDIFQFSTRDALVNGARVGVFARSAAASAVSVSFSNLQVRRLEGYVPSPVPSPTVYVVPSATRAPTFTPTP